MDPQLMMQLFSALGLGGQGGGGAPPPTPGGFGGSPVPYGTPSAGVPTAGVPASPQDVSPMPVEQSGWRPQMPTMDSFKSALGMSVPPPSPMMAPTGGVPNAGVSGVGMAPTSLGEALEPQPAPGTPMPQARPPGLGQPQAGNYGGSPATNPNLRPIDSPAAAKGPMDLAKILGGIKQPQGPDVVKPSTPAAHQTRQIGPSDLMALLTSLGMGGHRSQRTPTTLGQALELKPAAWGGIYG